MKKPSREKEQMQKLADRKAEKALKEDFPFEAQKMLHLIKKHDLVGEIMTKAMERGEFDNLAGAGKTLNLNENPLAPDELHMAHKVLKDNGYVPNWIALGKEISARREKLDQEIEYFKKYTQIFLREKPSSEAMRHLEQKKARFYVQTRRNLEEISQKILDYNLHCPVSQLGKANFNVDEELNHIMNDIEKSFN